VTFGRCCFLTLLKCIENLFGKFEDSNDL